MEILALPGPVAVTKPELLTVATSSLSEANVITALDGSETPALSVVIVHSNCFSKTLPSPLLAKVKAGVLMATLVACTS